MPGRSYRPGSARVVRGRRRVHGHFFVGVGAGTCQGRDGRSEAAPGAVPAVPAADTDRGARAGPRRPRADRRHPRGPAAPRVPVLRAARDRQDLHRADPGEDGQLRERARRPSPAASARSASPSARAQHLDVVEIDAASHGGVEDARELRETGAHRAGDGPREGLHHRRGAAAVPRGVRRAAEGVRGAAARRAVRAGHHRAAQDAGDDRRAVPAVRLPAAHHGDARRSSSRPIAASEGVALITRVRRARDRAPGRGLVARRALAAGPGERAGRRRRSTTPWCSRCWARRAARSSTSSPTPSRSATPAASFEIVNRLVQDGQDLRNVTAEALAHFREPLARQDRSRPGRPPRHPGRRVRAACACRPRSSPPASSRASSRCCSRRRTTCAGPPRRGCRWSSRLVRATIPETDPNPAGVVSRLERLERLGEPRRRSAVVRSVDGTGRELPAPPVDGRRAADPAEPPRRRPRRPAGRPRVGDADARPAGRGRRERGRRDAPTFVGRLDRPPGPAPPDDPPRRPRERDGRLLRRRDARARVPPRQALRRAEGPGPPG